MTTIETPKMIDRQYLTKAMDYPSYRKLIDDLLTDGKVTGPNQSEALANYTKMNVQRMQRIDKTVKLLPEVQEYLSSVNKPQTWLVITEGWCGDAAQILPVLQAMAATNPVIELKLLLRDENLELMDQYLTRGTSRSIPILIVTDTETSQELFHWGPRPAVLQEQFYQMREEGIAGNVVTEKIHSWYAKDKTATIQTEITHLLKQHTA